MPTVSVCLPTYNRPQFLPRALDSLLAQSYIDWEAWIVDDGGENEAASFIQPFLQDERIHLLRLPENVGTGAALNAALDRCTGELIAYLPDDDVYYRDHLASLVDCLAEHPEAVLAFSGVRHHYNRAASGILEGDGLQMVQVMHRRGPDRWLERTELVTDDLERMFWGRLRDRGEACATGMVTCEWVDHPHQLHKIIREPVGGINLYRTLFRVQHPLRFHTTQGNLMDEVEHFRPFRERPDTPPAPDGLKIVLAGELAYNAERVLALEELGHRLYGLWMPDPYWYNYVGPLPFGHVTDLPRDNWRQALRELQPDVIYALLNWQAVPWVLEVLKAAKELGIPLVWHYKEGPFINLEHATWRELVEIYQGADGLIYSSPEMQAWFETVIPHALQGKPAWVLDGDLPKREWFTGRTKPRLSAGGSGELHTVVPGRPIGLHPEDVATLANTGIHLHFYGNFTHGQWLGWIEKTNRLAPGYLHLHDQVDQENWAEEFSQYDAGWLHYFESQNFGEVRRANWDDLNYPARMATLAVAGLPLLQRANPGHIVATQNLAQELDVGFFFVGMENLRRQLDEPGRLEQVRKNMQDQQMRFCFDSYAGQLVDFFRQVISAGRSNGRTPQPAGEQVSM